MAEVPENQRQNHEQGSEIPVKPTHPYYMVMSPPGDESEISLAELFRFLMKNKWLIVGITFLFTVSAIYYALTATSIYRAEALLAPVQKGEGAGGFRALAGQYAGLAELAGVSFSGGGSIETVLATLGSRSFISGFIDDQDLKPLLFDENWDAEQKKWLVTSTSVLGKVKNIIMPEKKSVSPAAESLEFGEPSMWDAYRRLNDAISVTHNAKTGLVIVQVDWKDPILAADWANALVDRLNNELRQQAIKESERGIRFLQDQIQQTSLADLRTVLYRLVEEHTKNMTLAKVNEQYALKVIDPAIPPQERHKPKRKLIVGIGFILGLMGGVFSAFVWCFIRQQSVRGAGLMSEN